VSPRIILAPVRFAGRAMRQDILLTAIVIAFASPALASPRSEPPLNYLETPRDPVRYYQEMQESQRLLDSEKWAEAETLLRKLTLEYPVDAGRATSNWVRLAQTLRAQEKWREAISAGERVIQLQGPGLTYAQSSERYWIAVAYAALGEKDAAIDALETMVMKEHYLQRPDLAEDPNFASLKAVPRFRAVVGASRYNGRSRTAGWRVDIDYLVAEVKRSNPEGATITPAFEEEARKLKVAVSRMSDEEIVVGMSRMLSSLERGHTELWLVLPMTRKGLDYRSLPVRLYMFPDGLFVREASAGFEDLVGAEVLNIGGVEASAALERAMAVTPGESPAEKLLAAPAFLVSGDVLKGLGLTTRDGGADLTLRLKDGSVTTRTLEVADDPNIVENVVRLGAPPENAPILWSRPGEAHWSEKMPALKALYVQVNQMDSDSDETLPEFGLSVRKQLADQSIKRVIVDLRNNGGGNSFTYVELLRTLVQASADGRDVYVLIGRRVYSAAANFCADLERLVRPVFIGEATGGIRQSMGRRKHFSAPF